MEIRNRVAVISGGASGLGKATAETLVARGASVVLLDLPTSDGDALAQSLGERAAFSPGDVTTPTEVSAAIDLARSRFGALDIAVNCAGIGPAGRTVNRNGDPLSLDVFRTVIDINLVGTFNVIRLAAAAMIDQEEKSNAEERGVIINTASIAAFEGQIGQVAYAASKGGIVGLTLPVARDLAKSRIRCVTVAPGTIDTPLLSTLSNEVRTALAESIPHPSRLGRPEEYALLVAQLIENPLLNGTTIRLDGALRMAPS